MCFEGFLGAVRRLTAGGARRSFGRLYRWSHDTLVVQLVLWRCQQSLRAASAAKLRSRPISAVCQIWIGCGRTPLESIVQHPAVADPAEAGDLKVPGVLPPACSHEGWRTSTFHT